MRSPRLARTSLAFVVVALAAVPAASGANPLTAARAALNLPRTAVGMQARYDAGRQLEEYLYAKRAGCAAHLALAQGLVRWAEGYDRPIAALERAGRRKALGASNTACVRTRMTRRLPRLPSLPKLVRAAPVRSTDTWASAHFAGLGRAFPGYAAIWTHDLVSGRAAGWNSDARFPAASTVKLGVLLAALRRYPVRSPIEYDLRAMIQWSSNLAANRLLARVGGTASVEAALHQVGATRSTYPQGFRVGTSVHKLDVEREPPRVSGRVTTAHDLGRILYAIHAGALGNARALRRSGLDKLRSAYALSLLLASEARGNNVGLLRPWLPNTPVAQKNGWLHDARHTAAIVYFRDGPKIIVVLTYGPNLRLVRAQRLGLRAIIAAP